MHLHHLRIVASGIGIAAALGILAGGCSSKNAIQGGGDGGPSTGGDCANPPPLHQDIPSCTSCTFSPLASPSTCTPARVVNACCAYVQKPQNEIARGTGLHYFSSTDPNVDLSCLATPAAPGTPKTVTLTGYVKLFANGNDSTGVKIEIFQEGPNHDGALGPLVGAAITTAPTDPVLTPQPTWSSKCPSDGCKLRMFTYAGVPTETPLIIKTSDAAGTGLWADLYDYNIYLSNASLDASGNANYNPSTVASTDVQTVASVAGGFTVKPGKGLLAGEVHDCGDVRLSGAMVDTDQAHEAAMFYFGENEADPLPDQGRAPQGLGTSTLGLFGAINIAAGGPVRISAVGVVKGTNTLLGTYVVQVFPGAVTALSLRGRRPFQ